MKILPSAARYLFIICLPVILLTSTVRYEFSSLPVYEHGLKKYEISHVTGIDETQLTEIAQSLVDYFGFNSETPQFVPEKNGKSVPLFGPHELIHLEDVRDLLSINNTVFYGTLAYLVLYSLFSLAKRRNNWQKLARGAFHGCILTLVLLSTTGIIAYFNFEQLFLQFHHLAFTNPYWMLDPARDYLIMLFPAGFWEDAAILGAGIIGGKAIVLGGIVWAAATHSERQNRGTPTPRRRQLDDHNGVC